MILFLGECYNVMFALWHRLAVCRVMSSVTFVRLIDRVELFGNIFALCNSFGTWSLC